MASSALLKFKRLAQQSGELQRVRGHGPWVLPATTALEILNSLIDESIAVVGGDVWAQMGSGLEITADWYCEKTANETPIIFARRSLVVASNQLRKALQTGSSPSVDLVIKDAVTGDLLSSLGEP